jgi:hypothetical protein
MRSSAVRLFLLTTLLILGATTTAAAFAVNMTARGATSSYTRSDTVTVDVFLDAEPGIRNLAIPVVASNSGLLDYDPGASAASPRCATCIGPGTGGAQPSYILCAGGKPSTILYPQQTPAFLNWPAPPAGAEQVNINFTERAFGATTSSGTGIWIATLVFEVQSAFTATALSLNMDAGGAQLTLDGGVVVPRLRSL